jgi:hypothetical protein
MAMSQEAFNAACTLASSVGEKYADQDQFITSSEALLKSLNEEYTLGEIIGPVNQEEDVKIKECFVKAFDARRNDQKGYGNTYVAIGVGIGGLLLGGIIGYVMRGSSKSSASS